MMIDQSAMFTMEDVKFMNMKYLQPGNQSGLKTRQRRFIASTRTIYYPDGAQIKAARLAKGLSLPEAAKLLECTPGHICNIEQEPRNRIAISEELLAKLHEVFE